MNKKIVSVGKRILAIICAALLMGIILTGCKKGGTTTSDEQGSSSDSTITSGSTASTTAAGTTGTTGKTGTTANALGTITKSGGTSTTTTGSDTSGGAVATVQLENGIPRLFINGTRTEPIFFMPPYYEFTKNESLDSEMKYAAQYNVNVIIYPYGTDYYDLRKFFNSTLKGVIQNMLTYNPDAHLILRLNMVGTVSDFGLGSSEAVQLNGTDSDNVSMASDAWYEAAKTMLKDIVDNVMSDDYLSKYVVGFEYLGGNSGEWFEYDYWDGEMDTSECNRQKFAEYLTEKYQTDSALQAAWGDSSITLDTVKLPDYNTLPGIGNTDAQSANMSAGQLLLTSSANQIYVDYFDYLNSLRAERLCGFADTIKSASNNEKLAITYYGYEFETCTASSGHFDLSQLLQCSSIDMLSGPVSYSDRNDGGAGAYMSFVDSVTAAGKMWVDEGDYRSPVYTVKPTLAFPATTALMDQVMKREVAKCMTFKTGVWWLDLNGAGWFNYESFWKKNENMMNLMYNYNNVQQNTTPDICFIMDESAMSLVGNAQTYGATALQGARASLYHSGYSFGTYLLGDLIDGIIDNAKVYIIIDPWRLTSEQVSAIESKVHNSGKVTLYMYGNGLTSESDFQSLTGMAIHSVTGSGASEMSLSLADGISGGTVQDSMAVNPVYYVEPSSGVTTLGTYNGGAANGQIGFASYSGDDWTSVYFGGTRLTTDMIEYLASRAGVHRYANSGDVIYTGDKMVTLHAVTDGTKTVTFPSSCDIFNMETGEWSYDSLITLENVYKGETIILFYGDKDTLMKIVG